jgi:acyl carrier protein
MNIGEEPSRASLDAVLVNEVARKAWVEALDTFVEDTSDLFELGGDSMAAVSIVTEVGDLLGCEIDIALLYSNSALGDFAAAVTAAAVTAASAPGATAASATVASADAH